MAKHYDVLIIGAGMSGLAAGIRLAYYNKRVCILERHYRVGGLNSFYTFHGRKLDVGLHALTNYAPSSARASPLPRLLRQLKLKADDFVLCPQRVSAIKFPGKTLRFGNDFALLAQEVAEAFPRQADSFQKLLKVVLEHDDLNLSAKPVSARAVVNSIITDQLLSDMIFCPLMFYGSAQEDDMEFGQFVIMFKSVFCEGLARPQDGVRRILDVLVRKYRSCGGELRVRCAVTSLDCADGRVASVRLADGKTLTADSILSSAGYVETMRLLTGCDSLGPRCQVGQLSFTESIFLLDREPADMGYDTTITFYSKSDRFAFRKPVSMIDVSSGVICCPNNFELQRPLPEGMIRITNLANFDRWNGLDNEEYKAQKVAWLEAVLKEVVELVPDFRGSVKLADVFTPRTIHRFTGHVNGTVYGMPSKIRTGRTHLDNLFICGTDQGFLGIVGAMLSGISMANLHILQKTHEQGRP